MKGTDSFLLFSIKAAFLYNACKSTSNGVKTVTDLHKVLKQKALYLCFTQLDKYRLWRFSWKYTLGYSVGSTASGGFNFFLCFQAVSMCKECFSISVSLMKIISRACPYLYPLVSASAEKIQKRVYPYSHDWEKFSSRLSPGSFPLL